AGISPLLGNAGSSDWNLGTPFFPLLKSGLDGLGTDAMDSIAHFELRRPENLMILLAGQQFCQLTQVRIDSGFQNLINPIGFLLPLRRQRLLVHGGSFMLRIGVEFTTSCHLHATQAIFPPTFQLHTRDVWTRLNLLDSFFARVNDSQNRKALISSDVYVVSPDGYGRRVV